MTEKERKATNTSGRTRKVFKRSQKQWVEEKEEIRKIPQEQTMSLKESEKRRLVEKWT